MRFQCQQCNSILELDNCLPGELVQCDKCGSAVAVPATPFSPGAIIGEFAIKQELGVGGMGTVYLAHQLTLDRDVALKVLKPKLAADAAFIGNFVNEARAVASINHPNIVQAFAVQREASVWYFAMEYVDGPTVHSMLAKGEPLSYEQTLQIAREMVSGLKYAWDTQQMIHRDIKPDNIMLNSSGHAKLADLGLACKGVGLTSQSSDLYGTPQYVAPELILGYASDIRSDIYSLGATLYHTITGEFPYMADTADELIMRHLQVPLRPVIELAPTCPVPFAALIENMMIKRPAQRYQDYATLEADLNLVANGQMPSMELPPEAQYPINVEIQDPLALENAIVLEGISNSASAASSNVPRGGRRSLKLSSATATSMHTASRTSIRLGAGASQSVPLPPPLPPRKNKNTGVILGIAIGAVVLLAVIIGVAIAASGDDKQEVAVQPVAPVVASTQAAAEKEEEAAPEDLFNLKRLKILVGQNSDQGLDEIMSLYAKDPTRMAEVYAAAVPLLESRLATARQMGIQDSENLWTTTVERIKEEKRQREEEARRVAEEERKKREEEERIAAEKEREEKRLRAIAEGMREKMENLHRYMENLKFTSAVMMFQTSFDDEEEEQRDWRMGWVNCISAAERVHNSLTGFRGVDVDTAKAVIPVFAFYKVHRDAMSEDENYAMVPFLLTAFDGKKATFSVPNKAILSKLPLMQRRRYHRDMLGTTTFSVDFKVLLPEQQIAIVQAAMKKTDPEVDKETVTDLIGAYCMTMGNYLPSVFEDALFENFRNANPVWEAAKKDYAMTVDNNMARRHEQNLRELLKLARANQRSLNGKVYETTLRRYVYVLKQAFPEGGDELKQVLNEIRLYLHSN